MQPPSHTASLTDTAVQWPDAGEVWRTLTLQAGFNSATVVIAATLLGVAAGVVGVFALLRKRALMGDCLAHCTLPGIALAFLAATWLGREGRSLWVLLPGAAASGVLGILCVQGIIRHTRLRDDAAIGAVLSVFFGAGIVLLSYIQGLSTGNQGGLAHFIYGQTAAMRSSDAALMGATALGVIAVSSLMFKEFRAVCFDDRFAASMGLKIGLVDFLMMTLVVVVTVIGLQAVGLILVIALLIIPAAAARFWTERLSLMTPLAAGIGGLSGYLGACASALVPRLPAGAVIVLTAGVIFIVSMLTAPTRGVLAAAVRRVRLRIRIASDHFLRAMFESLESTGAPRAGVLIPVGSAPSRSALLTSWLALRGLIRRDGARVSLTPAGLDLASRLTRNHRLWERFMVRHADLAASHVDLSADYVEHALPPELFAGLEDEFIKDSAPVPPSIHPIPRRP